MTVIDEKEGTCQLGVWPLVEKVTATAKWVQYEDGSKVFKVPYKASGIAPLSSEIEIPVPESENTKGTVDLMTGVTISYELTDHKQSEDHAHCHVKATINSPIGSCVLFDDDFDGPLAHVTKSRYEAAMGEAIAKKE